MSERYRLRTDELYWHEIDNEVIVLDAATSRYLGANQSGAVLWEVLDRGASRSELEEALVTSYQVEPAVARDDVEAFLVSLRELGLLETLGP